MKKFEVTISLRNVRTAYWRMNDSRYIRENGEWTASDTYESNEFDEDDDDEMEEYENLRDAVEQMLSDCEFEINEVTI